jgi:transposase InsO family protein
MIVSLVIWLIQEICVKNHYHYGHRKVREILRLQYGTKFNCKTVQKIMQKRKLQCRVKKKRQNWINGESKIIVPSCLNRDFTASQPNEKWVTDITYLPFGTSILYLSTIIMNLYNNEIIAD